MKKFLSLALVALMLMPCFVLSAFAVKAGESVTVEFATTNNPGFASYDAIVEYDKAALELIAINAGELCKAGLFAGNPASAKVSYANTSDVTGDGILFTATFKVKEDVSGVLNVKANFTNIVNAAASSVTVKVDEETVNVECTHKYGEWTVVRAATCKAEGLEERVCSVCGGKETRPIAKLDHTVEIIPGKAATCDTDGLTEGKKCSVCGEILVEQNVIPALGHKWEWVVDKKPTATETGLKHEECSICGAKRNEGTVIPALEGLDDVPATNDVSVSIALVTVLALTLVSGTAIVLKRREN